MIFKFYEQKYLGKVYLKLNLAQSTKFLTRITQEMSTDRFGGFTLF